MRCPECDYSLWGASPPGPCPECGRHFRTTEFIFARGRVRFLCPKCGEGYQGTDYEGLPDPRTFACVTCGEQVDADEMPAELVEGVAEKDALVLSPWVRRKTLGLRVAAHKTAVASLINPSKIVQGVTDVRVGAAMFFAVIVWALVIAVMFLFLMIFAALAIFFGGGGGVGITSVLFAVFVGFGVQICIGAVFALFIVVPIQALLAHGILVITGSRRAGLGTTLACMYYGQGPMILNIIPICGWNISGVWVWVSSIVLLKTAQQVSGWRAAIAVLVPAIGVVVVVVVAYGMLFALGVSSGGGFSVGVQTTNNGPSTLASAMVDYTTETGRAPNHVLDLVIDERIDSSVLESFEAASLAVLPDGSLIAALDTMDPDELTSLRDSLLDDEPLYTFGSFIFTHRMADLSSADPELWVAFSSPPAPQNPPAVLGSGDTDFFWVYLEVHQANGRDVSIFGNWSEIIEAQNIIREAEGLTPIPTDITTLPK